MDADPCGSSTLRFSAFSNMGLALLKGTLALSCGSAALYASTLYSLSNTVNTMLSMLGLKMASRPADVEHPFGYGKDLYFWSFIASVFMLGVASMGSIDQGIRQIINQTTINTARLPVIILAAAFAYECFLFSITGKNMFKKGNNPVNRTVVVQSGASVMATGISLVAMAMTHWTGNYLFDGLASISVGFLLAVMAITLAYKLKDLIIGRSANPAIVRLIGEITMMVTGVKGIREIKTMYVGPQSLLVNMEIAVDCSLDVQMLESISEVIEKSIKNSLTMVEHINIETVADDMVREWKSVTMPNCNLKTLGEITR